MTKYVEFSPTSIRITTREAHESVLLPMLQRLDGLLEQACLIAQDVYGPQRITDLFRGLHISHDEVKQLLASPPATSLLYVEPSQLKPYPEAGNKIEPLTWLINEYNLSPFDIDVLMIALAPELDLRYERLYAYLQDDVSRKRPSIDLVLNLLSTTPEDRLACLAHFSPAAPLIKHDLLQLIPESSHTQPSLLSHYLKLDEQIVHLLLEQPGVSASLATFVTIQSPEPWRSDDEELLSVLATLVRQSLPEDYPLRLFFHGPRGVGKLRAAQALAANVRKPLLLVDLVKILNVTRDVGMIFTRVFRQARFQDALLYLENLDELAQDEQALQSLFTALAASNVFTILAGTQARFPVPLRGHYQTAEVIAVHFPTPTFVQRRHYWRIHLEDSGVHKLEEQLFDDLATRFRLTEDQIRDAVVAAHNAARWRAAARSATKGTAQEATLLRIQPTREDLLTAAREQSRQSMEALARKVESSYTWDDIVLPPDQLAQLREICDQARYRHKVYAEWGFEHKLHLGRDLSVLFSGLSGTGKTMAAEVLATTLSLDLYKINLSQIVSKYIGETEKNLDRIFTAAENTNAILFFDEADALFGKRSQVNDAHDRYANIEVGYLLQKLEEYDGIVILATNLRNNMDEAFTRRLKFSVEFPFPDEAYRNLIWRGQFPADAPLSDDIDFAFLARQFRIAGGNIKNIVLNASFLAASDESSIQMKHLILAARREFQKMGIACTEAIFGEYFPLISNEYSSK